MQNQKNTSLKCLSHNLDDFHRDVHKMKLTIEYLYRCIQARERSINGIEHDNLRIQIGET